MKTLLLTLALCFISARCAVATPQANDTIVIGGNSYGIFQLPMSSYWRGEHEPADGRLPIPNFEVTSSANWRGYIAKWSIDSGQLYLRRIKGKIDGKKVRDQEIIKKRFPVRATWFTGKIFVAVGDFDDEKKAYEYVLEFTIENGNVRSTTYHESLKIPMTLNGLPNASASDEDRIDPAKAAARRVVPLSDDESLPSAR